MTTFTLIIFIWAGAWAKGNDATMFALPGFSSAQECEAAASKLSSLVASTVQEVRHVCVAQTTKSK